MSDANISTTSFFRKIFHGLEDNVREELRHVAERKEYPAGQVLCQQGRREHTFYIVVEGRVVVTQRLEDGEERILGIRGPKEYFGEMGLLDNMPRMASCTALTPVIVWEISEEAFDRLVEESPAIAYAITRQILETLRHLDRQAIDDLLAKNRRLTEAYDELRAAQLALVEKERLEREMEIAADVQRSLLPGQLPEMADYHFAAYLEPARQVGGDFYDVIDLDEAHLGILMADVADKSVHAALFMAVCRTLFLVESQRSRSPAVVAQAVHQGMLAVSPEADTFVTAFYGVLHRHSGVLTYVIAGQERPLLARPAYAVAPLPGKGRFLGMLPDLHLDEYAVRLRPGDRLVLFSDGVPDAENRDGIRFGIPQLAEFMQRSQQRPAAALLESIVSVLTEWTLEAEPVDDLTVLVVEVSE